MAARNRPNVAGAGDYSVGYRKPPVHSRFRAGQSGNPAGRPKGVRNLKTDVVRTLSAPVRVKEAGRSRTRSTQEGALMVLREKALRGDTRSLDRLFELALRFNSDITEVRSTVPLSTDDRAILSAYVAEQTAPTSSSTEAGSRTEAVQEDPRPDGKEEPK
jgi:hypothetical protein